MSNFSGLSPNNPTRYTGAQVALATVVSRNRAPTGADYRQPETGKLYPFDTYWIVSKDPTTGVQGDLWYLSKIVANVAYWLMLSTGGSGPMLSITVPLGESPIVPDGSGVVNFTSSGGTVAITGSSASPNNHTINFDLTGGGLGVDSFQVQAATVPGVNPVTPTGLGLVNVNATTVANHSVPIETRTRALNTYNIEAQIATSAAATDATKNGLAHYNSNQFSIDSNGFVSLTGGGLAIDSIGTQTGTNPIVPTAAGLVTINGAVVAAGTNPVRSDGTGANTMAIEVQISQALAATDATKIGLSNFNSAIFTVDGNGFVSLPNAAISWTPELRFGGANTGITYISRGATYWKIGKLVHFYFKIVLSNKGSAVGFCTITGFPSASTEDQTFTMLTQDCTLPATTTAFTGVVGATLSYVVPYGQASASTTQLANTNFTNTSVIQMSGFYWEA